MTLPTMEEISPTRLLNLDEKSAYDNFFNLNIDAAYRLISENPSLYLDDLAHMGPRAFAYYSEAAAIFLSNDPCRENVDLMKAMIIARMIVESDDHDFVQGVEVVCGAISSAEQNLPVADHDSYTRQVDAEYRESIKGKTCNS